MESSANLIVTVKKNHIGWSDPSVQTVHKQTDNEYTY